MKMSGEIEYPEYLEEVAGIIGRLRYERNRERMKENPRYDRGEMNEAIDIDGVLGELIARHLMWKEGKKISAGALLADHPVSGFDIRVGEYEIDVKTVRTGERNRHFLVNKESFEKKAGVGFYMFVHKVREGLAWYRLFTRREISEWQVRNMGYTDAYIKEIPHDTTTESVVESDTDRGDVDDRNEHMDRNYEGVRGYVPD